MNDENQVGSGKGKLILRWISVLPVGIVGLLVGMIIVNIISWLVSLFAVDNYGQGFNYNISYYIFSPLIGGILGVFWSAKTAPSHRKIVATVMAAIILIVSVLGTLASISVGERSLFWILVNGLAIAIGAGYMMYKVYEDEDNFTFLNQ